RARAARRRACGPGTRGRGGRARAAPDRARAPWLDGRGAREGAVGAPRPARCRVLMAELRDRVVLVTGSSRGIGAEVATRAAVEGPTVPLHYRAGAAAARAIVEKVRATGSDGDCFDADVADGGQATRLVE